MTSAIDVKRLHTLGETEGYTVESADGSIGWVEEVWLGERRTPQALAMRAPETEWPLWKAVAVLYCTIALLLTLMITLAFTIAWAVAGTAY